MKENLIIFMFVLKSVGLIICLIKTCYEFIKILIVDEKADSRKLLIWFLLFLLFCTNF
jgi:hypothetical protein